MRQTSFCRLLMAFLLILGLQQPWKKIDYVTVVAGMTLEPRTSGKHQQQQSSNNSIDRHQRSSLKKQQGGSHQSISTRRRKDNRRGGINNSRNKSGYALRAAGIKVQSKHNKRRTPRWEQEGDALYQQLISVNSSEQMKGNKNIGMEEAMILLKSLATLGEEQTQNLDGGEHKLDTKQPASKGETPSPVNDNETNTGSSSPPAHAMWGKLPVGPVLRTSLLNAKFHKPTPIQTAAFPILTRRANNAVLASPTGSGKSLAYLLPLLSSSSLRNKPCQIIIVTPTVELSMQLQRQVDALWPPPPLAKGKNDNSKKRSSLMHVLRRRDDSNEGNGVISGGDDDGNRTKRMLLLPEIGEDSVIVAGTPRTLRALLSEVSDNPNSIISKAIRSNLRTVVLDECDRLLNTQGVARAAKERAQHRDREKESSLSSTAAIDNRRKPRKGRGGHSATAANKITQTEILLYELPVRSLQDLQLVCASATVGRTLRRQLMDLLQVSSIDKAATLITGEDDVRTKKNAYLRKASLVPATLSHRYLLLPLPQVDFESKNEAEEQQQQEIITAMWQTMQGLEKPAPILIFPGRVGVERVEQGLKGRHCDQVRTLLASNGDLWCQNVNATMSGNEEGGQTTNIATSWWQNVPIYVVPERFGRGLDLPDIRYVFLLSPPSSAAGYAHLAGRTGRNGRHGTAITFLRPREASKLVAIATAMGLPFEPILA